jgi:hypothetical protein
MTAPSALHWLVYSPAGLVTRVCIGLAIFAALAIVDLRAHGRNATRWREYAFLLLCVVAAVGYGALNDQITSRISWEYFYYAKELSKELGPEVPPDPAALRRAAAIVGAKAAWSAGLLIGVALLIANNPRQDRPRLSYRTLVGLLATILACAAACGAVFGVIGYRGGLTWASEDFREMWQTNLFRPRRFLCTWGVHLGGYLGALVGTAICVVYVLNARGREYGRRHPERTREGSRAREGLPRPEILRECAPDNE